MKITSKKGPLYFQVKDILKERIISGFYPKNSLIPSEPALEKEFSVSKITIRKAVEQLAIEGYVEKRSGVGTKVLDNKVTPKISRGQNFSDQLVKEGFDLKKDNISISVVSTEGHRILQANMGSECYCLERLYLLDNEPYIYFKHYIPLEALLPLKPELFKGSLYELLFQKGMAMNHFKDEFDVEIPEGKIALTLNTGQKPLLKRIRSSFDIDEKLVEYSIAFYHTDMHKYVVQYNV
ncbi:GntR family transcriptional regulator [Halobacillus naozhouensis]|uniref:GntR family transcriptional regulator n=1 Tax=Halobacillus naozhouensis TaxID=554880 RepID=A0ABY8J4L7_9BACI|nr:GntR family transcriptional regulator [Halobacillus naozhouensis]WFT76389.1 GntR family transcriptional regulator [Halobacillus naozhouensis]